MLHYFLNLSLLTQIFLLYFITINIVTFFYFGLDKLKSQTGDRRISEKMLWILTLIGGSAGALLAMWFFRHKTKKLSFQAVVAVILVVQIWVVYLILN